MSNVTVETLPEIVWQNQKVITTELLAQCYETDIKRISNNYLRNKKRFIEGKHFFKLEGDVLRQFKSDPRIMSPDEPLPCGSPKMAELMNVIMDTDRFVPEDEIYRPSERGSVKISANVKALILWTERGASRHAKILDNDKAWDVFDRMEEVYFHPDQHTDARESELAKLQTEHITLQSKYIQMLEAAREQLTVARGWTSNEDDKLLELKDKGLNATQIGVELGRSSGSVKGRLRRLKAKEAGQ